jgi:hypothetical protein
MESERDGRAARAATLPPGNVYIVANGHRVRKVDRNDLGGNVYIADRVNQRVRDMTP